MNSSSFQRLSLLHDLDNLSSDACNVLHVLSGQMVLDLALYNALTVGLANDDTLLEQILDKGIELVHGLGNFYCFSLRLRASYESTLPLYIFLFS